MNKILEFIGYLLDRILAFLLRYSPKEKVKSKEPETVPFSLPDTPQPERKSSLPEGQKTIRSRFWSPSKRFGDIITFRPLGMYYRVYREKRKKQQREIKRYLHGTAI